MGLHAFTIEEPLHEQNISDTLIYKYFGGIDEVLIAVVNEYAAFDVNTFRGLLRDLTGHTWIRSSIMQIHMQHIMITILVWVR